MVSGLESVTLAVDEVDAALASFRAVPGLQRESDGNASVSLLAAWRYPVHADVRLVELSCAGGPGRVRLARFDPHVVARREDLQPRAADPAAERGQDEAVRHFYGDGLGLSQGLESALAGELLEVVQRLAGESGTQGACDLISLCARASSAQPSSTPGHAGVNLLTLACTDLDVLEARLRELESEIVTRPTHVALGAGAPTRIMLARGPRQELLEFLERDA